MEIRKNKYLVEELGQVFTPSDIVIKMKNLIKNNGKIFATDRDISVTEKSKLDIHLRFKQYNFNETQSFPFTVPKSYKAN